MTQHSSFKRAGSSVGSKRSVLKRLERVDLLRKRNQWKEGRRLFGLPKTKPEE
ncbi:MAG: small basic protein [Puniceicoccales bacterium]|nr:small basic protein [Puniceicoccales bacterium]